MSAASAQGRAIRNAGKARHPVQRRWAGLGTCILLAAGCTNAGAPALACRALDLPPSDRPTHPVQRQALKDAEQRTGCTAAGRVCRFSITQPPDGDIVVHAAFFSTDPQDGQCIQAGDDVGEFRYTRDGRFIAEAYGGLSTAPSGTAD